MPLFIDSLASCDCRSHYDDTTIVTIHANKINGKKEKSLCRIAASIMRPVVNKTKSEKNKTKKNS